MDLAKEFGTLQKTAGTRLAIQMLIEKGATSGLTSMLNNLGYAPAEYDVAGERHLIVMHDLVRAYLALQTEVQARGRRLLQTGATQRDKDELENLAAQLTKLQRKVLKGQQLSYLFVLPA